jgi:AmiR/NasT family two-component response regulator
MYNLKVEILYDSKILIVEDEFIVAQDITMRLKNMGYDIVGVVDNGNDAIKKTGETRPDIVLMDIDIKGDIDGIDTAQKIYDLYNVPYIYLTGYYDLKTIKRAKKTEASGYIIKPFDETGLHAAIQMAVYKHKNEQKPVKISELIKFATEKAKEINKPLK